MGRVPQRLAGLSTKVELQFARLRTELLDRIRDTKVSLLPWVFGFWIGTALVILGLCLANSPQPVVSGSRALPSTANSPYPHPWDAASGSPPESSE
jgi:hypothetical protein